jgi:class 3 adenylate cyclase
VGIHAGDVIREAQTIFGGAVNMTARICDVAGPGELVVSAAAAADLPGAGLELEELGPQDLKGFDQPVTLFTVRPGAGT